MYNNALPVEIEKPKSLIERIQESRREYGLKDDDFDFSAYYQSIRQPAPMTRPTEEHLFDEV